MRTYIFHKILSSLIAFFCIVRYLVNKLKLKPKRICFQFLRLHDFEMIRDFFTNLAFYIHYFPFKILGPNVIAIYIYFSTKDADLSMQNRNRYIYVYI